MSTIMDNTIINYLEKLELSEFEVKLYLTILELGPKSVRELAHELEINRTTVYFYIDQLIEKELVMKVVKGLKTLIVLNEPRISLEALVAKKVQSVRDIQKDLHGITDRIVEKYVPFRDIGDAEIRHYKGKLGVKKIYEEALQANELRTYVLVAETGNIFPDNVKMFNTAFKQNPNLVVQEMLYDSPLATKDAEQLLAKNDGYSFKLMPKDLKLSSEDILIYDGTVAFINYKGNISSIVLKNIDNYRNAKELFDFIWKMLP
jgi:sugar-specific transcriptional regulator TrmB